MQPLRGLPPVSFERSGPPGLGSPPPVVSPEGPSDVFERAEEPPVAFRRQWGSATLAAMAAVGVLGGLAVQAVPGLRTSKVKAQSQASLGPWREGAEAVGRPRAFDAREAREARQNYREVHRALDQAVEQARADLERLGEGTHTLAEGRRLVLKKAPQGVVTAHYQGGEATLVTFRPDEPGRASLTQGAAGARLEATRVGSTLEFRRFGRQTETWTADGEVLSGRVADRQIRVAPDGEVTILEGPGRLATVIVPDLQRVARDEILAGASSRLHPDGRREPLSQDVRAQLSDALDGHAPGTLQTLVDSGLKFQIVDSQAAPPPGGFPGGTMQWPKDATGKEEAGGYYNPYVKTVVLRSDMLDRPIVIHETAHALDDFGAPDVEGKVVWESEADPGLVRLFQAYQKRAASDKALTWSDYALVNAQEYFAKGVEFHEGSPEDRATLKRLDPELARFIEARLLQGAFPNRKAPVARTPETKALEPAAAPEAPKADGRQEPPPGA